MDQLNKQIQKGNKETEIMHGAKASSSENEEKNSDAPLYRAEDPLDNPSWHPVKVQSNASKNPYTDPENFPKNPDLRDDDNESPQVSKI